MKALLLRLAKLNIVLETEDGQLNIFDPDQNLTDELLLLLKEKKSDLLSLFKGNSYKKGYTPIPNAGLKPYFLLSSAQKRLYFLYELDKQSTAYNITEVLKLQDDLEREQIQQALNHLIARHESLRTYFKVVEEKPVQIILPEGSVKLEDFTCEKSGLTAIAKSFRQVFDLSQAPLLQMGFVTCDSGEHFLLVNMHHIITDQVSKDILIEDFMALCNGEILPELKLQYKDYAEWQSKRIQEQEYQKQEAYWMQELSNDLPRLKLPLDFQRPEKENDRGGTVSLFLDKKEKEIIEACCKQYKLTPSMLFLSAFNVFLSKLSGQEDVVVGLSVAGRNHPDLARIIGMFVNLLPIRSFPRYDKPILDFMEEVKQSTLLAFENQEVQFDSLVDKLGGERKLGQNAIVDVILNFITKTEIEIDWSEVKEGLVHENGSKRYDLTLNVSHFANAFLLELQYDANLFRPDTSESFLKSFLNILTSLGSIENRNLGDIAITPSSDIQKVEEYLMEYIHEIPSVDQVIPASYHQERMWFIDQFESGYLYEGSPIYHNIPLIIDFKGLLNIDFLEKSLGTLQKRYPVLRTQIHKKEERLFQRLTEAVEFVLPVLKIEREIEEADPIVSKEVNRPFAMDKILFRALLVGGNKNHSKLILTLHHSISDHYSTTFLAKDLLSIYYDYEKGVLPTEKKKTPSYSGFSIWQQTILPKLEPYLMSYWKRQLAGKLKALELPLDRPRAAIHIYEGASQKVLLSSDLIENISIFEKELGIDRRIILMAAFKILLYKYVQHEEIVIGTSVDNRVQDEMKRMVGPVANLIVLNSRIFPEINFEEYVTQLKLVYENGLKYQSMSFDKLVKELAPAKDMSRTALFDVLFQFEVSHLDFPRITNLEAQLLHTNVGYGKYDLNLFLEQRETTIQGQLVYNLAYFDKITIERFILHYTELLHNLIANPKREIATIRMTTEKEEAQLLNQLNNKNVLYPKGKTIIDFFEEQVQGRPHQIAIDLEGQNLTYAELDVRSTQLGQLLKASGVERNQIVGLLTDRSLETVISMLAILKAGGAYLPIDINYPEERIKYIIEDSRIEIIITTKDHVPKVPGGIQVLLLEEVGQTFTQAAYAELHNENEPSDLCYVIYTSGTTGNPKGVMVEHRNVVRLFFNETSLFDFGPDDIWTMFHSHCFDFSVWEMYGALLFGGKLIVVPEAIAKDTSLFLEVLKKEKVTVLNQTPSAFYNLMRESLAEGNADVSLRYVIFGGEALNPAQLKPWKLLFPETKLINMFGITETTVHVTYKEIGMVEIENNISNVGKPIPTLSVYILDEQQHLVPRGVIGELYVGGAGVTRGYLGKPKLTSEKFVSDPYLENEKLYRSGDLARILNTGDIEYIGRIDHQIQLRGFRIELSEIEHKLAAHQQIEEVVTIARGEEGDKHIVAYYVGTQELEVHHLRSFLSEHLPDYMIPSYFVYLSRIPLTPNGKVDRESLPNPQIKPGNDYEPPASEIEEKLVEIWSEVLMLKKNKISTNKSFFELGGHSLRAAVLANKILREFQIKIPLREFFISQTIRELSQKILSETKSVFSPIKKTADKNYYKLSSAQKRLYVLYKFNRNSLAYNMPYILRMSGDLNVDKLHQAFEKLILRHESLRTSFQMLASKTVQRVHSEFSFKIQRFSSNLQPVESIIKQFIQPFKLEEIPLLRVGLIETGIQEHLLIVDMHHIISDGVSQSLLVKDFMALYNNESLPLLQLQYKDFSEWQQNEEQQKKIAKEQLFWSKEFSELPEVLILPTDFERPSVKRYEGASLDFKISEKELSSLRDIAAAGDTTLFIVLLAIFNIFLAKLGNSKDVVVGIPVAGRPHVDLENMIGMFVNTLPLRNLVNGDWTFRYFLAVVKSKILTSFDNESYPYEDLVDSLDLLRDTSRNPLFDVMFTYQNFEENRLEIPGLVLSPYETTHKVSKFDLSLVAIELSGQLHIAFEYATTLFKEETIARFAVYFKNILSRVLSEIDTKISAIDMLPIEEKKVLLSQFNDTNVAYPKEKTIVDLFRTQAGSTPKNIALRLGKQTMTYAELDEKSGRIAAYLREKKMLKNGELVGIMLEREWYLIPMVFGILKAGGAYVPIDSHFPQKRILSIIKDSGMKHLITRTTPQTEITDLDLSVINLQESLDNILSTEALQDDLTITSDQLAYVIYTSGSTGKPKGVMVEHHSVINRILWMQKAYPLTEKDVLLQKTPIVFDVSVWELFWWSFTGASLTLLRPEEEKAPKEIIKTIVKNRVTTLHFVPSMLNVFLAELEHGFKYSDLSSRRQVFASGEALKYDQVKLFGNTMNKHCGSRLINLYGPTEATIDVSYYECNFKSVPANIPIGKPIDNTQLLIIDQYNNLAPVGTRGELHIAGAGVARGYLNNRKLTNEKFIKKPSVLGGKYYKTGDLTSWLPNGDIAFWGRIDSQVKIRGFRMELGEIETCLLAHIIIKDVRVLVRERNGEKEIVAYYLSEVKIEISELKVFLLAHLPDYMIPSFFVHLKVFPLTINGKLDRKALPDPEVEKGGDFTSPINETQKEIIEIWAETLDLKPEVIGINKNFFDIGGNSLKLISMVNKLNEQMNQNLSVIRVFEFSTVGLLAAYVDQGQDVDQVEEEEDFSLEEISETMSLFDEED